MKKNIFNIRKYASILPNLVAVQESLALNNIDKRLYSREISILKDIFRAKPSDSALTYKKREQYYATRYLLPNVIKNLYVIEELNAAGILNQCHHIVDLGSGPGTFAIALAYWRHVNKTDTVLPHITMIEPEDRFCELADKLLCKLDEDLGTYVKYSFLRQSVVSRLPYKGKCDLIILSNSASEIFRSKNVNPNPLVLDIISKKAIVAIIDYPYDEFSEINTIINQFMKNMTYIHFDENSLPEFGEIDKPFCYNVVDLGKLNGLLDKVHLSLPSFCGQNIRFLKSIWMPCGHHEIWSKVHKNLNVFMNYKYAWERHDKRILANIFSADAIYKEKEGTPPLRGINKIIEYWQYNAQKQNNVKFHARKIFWSSLNSIAKWDCCFYRTDKKCLLKLKGVMALELKRGKIFRFEEKFEKESVPTEPISNDFDASHQHDKI